MALIRCVECGKEISDRADKCPNCGCPLAMQFVSGINNSKIPVEIKEDINRQNTRSKVKIYSTPRLVIGIISIVLFLIVTLQSCVAGIANTLSGRNEWSGSFGLLLAICMLVAGIVTVCMHNKKIRSAYLVPFGFYYFGALIAAPEAISYTDLKIWAVLSSLFAVAHLVFMFNAYRANLALKILTPTVLVILVIMYLPLEQKSEEEVSEYAPQVSAEVEANTANREGAEKPISEPAKESVSADDQKVYGIGEIANINGTLVSLIDYEETSGDEWSEPDEGNVYLYINMNFENNGDEDVNISSMLSFENYCDGYKLDYSGGALLSGNYQQLDGTISPGKKLKGSLALEVPSDWSEVEVQFTDDVWSDSKVVFVINK